jgi:hypothetical protein
MMVLREPLAQIVIPSILKKVSRIGRIRLVYKMIITITIRCYRLPSE